MISGIYLGAKRHRISNFDILYNDIINFPGIDIVDDMLNIDLTVFDFVIATPPCNYYSKANYRRDISKVALESKHLLPDILEKLKTVNVPFLVENVCNKSLLPSSDFIEFDFGGHHFYTNICWKINFQEYKPSKVIKQLQGYGYRDNNYSVDFVIRSFLEVIHSNNGYYKLTYILD